MIAGKTIREALAGRTFDFACSACGRCCSGPGEVYFTDEDLEKIYIYLKLDANQAQALKRKLIQFRRRGLHTHSSGKTCLFLKKNLCTIYPVRPLQCRTFPFWPSNFSSPESLDELRTECPGSLKGTGEQFTFQETTRRVRETEREFAALQDDPDRPFMI